MGCGSPALSNPPVLERSRMDGPLTSFHSDAKVPLSCHYFHHHAFQRMDIDSLAAQITDVQHVFLEGCEQTVFVP